ncbi:hypothetical protein EB796_010026 [Bugula neritina]|uniref:Uncharacterized protein n=1 Tax=Bugula neritina TaxID=10212 RepID=A0A7J7K0G5_BUGNE|nr:hypothetical protein EB796_010026 [Bugula neritina]
MEHRDLEPPGIQTRLHRPYPSPEPLPNYQQKGETCANTLRQPTPQLQEGRAQSRAASVDSRSYVVKIRILQPLMRNMGAVRPTLTFDHGIQARYLLRFQVLSRFGDEPTACLAEGRKSI